MTEEAKAIVEDNIDKVVLVDVAWGNSKASTYFSRGHVQELFILIQTPMRDHVYMCQKREQNMQKNGD